MCAQYSASSWSYDQLGRPLIESRTNNGSANTNYVVNDTYYKDGSLKTLTYGIAAIQQAGDGTFLMHMTGAGAAIAIHVAIIVHTMRQRPGL